MIATVSVIIPLHNLRAYVAEAIESVLGQTLSANQLEIIVVDDGSTDGSDEVAAAFVPRVRYLRQENRGLSAARNAGVRESRGVFLAFLDADDRYLPCKLELEAARLAARPEVGVVYSGWRYIAEDGRALPPSGWPRLEGDILDTLILGCVFPPVAIMVRRALVEQAGGFDETLTSLEDWDLWLRTGITGARWSRIDKVASEYRVRRGAMHTDAVRMQENRLRILQRFFSRSDVPARLARRHDEAFQAAFLIAASTLQTTGEQAGAVDALHAAARLCPAVLADRRRLLQLCRLLLPEGYQRQQFVVSNRRVLTGAVGSMLQALFARTDLPPEIAGMRGRAHLALWRLSARLLRKRLFAPFRSASIPCEAWRTAPVPDIRVTPRA